jgi:hypothetical protein
MKPIFMTSFVLFLITNLCSVWAGDYSFSGYEQKWFGSEDRSCMCTVSFSADGSSPSGEVSAAFRFINAGKVPIKGDPFFSQKAEIVSKDGKTYEMSWYSEEVELEDGRIFEVPGKATPEKVKDVVAHHPELRKISRFEKLSTPLKQELELEEATQKKSIQLINPGGVVEKVLYNKDPLIRDLLLSRNVDRVIFQSGMGKFVLRPSDTSDAS